MAAAPADPGALAKQCKELQRKLDEALRERDDLVRDLATDDYGVVVMCSAMAREYALESNEHRHGYFVQTRDTPDTVEFGGLIKRDYRRGSVEV